MPTSVYITTTTTTTTTLTTAITTVTRAVSTPSSAKVVSTTPATRERATPSCTKRRVSLSGCVYFRLAHNTPSLMTYDAVITKYHHDPAGWLGLHPAKHGHHLTRGKFAHGNAKSSHIQARAGIAVRQTDRQARV